MTEYRTIDLGHINLRGNASDKRFADGAAEVLGQKLPLRPNTLTQSEHRVYWLGPDEWQIVTAPDRAAELFAQLEQKFAAQHVATNDLSGGQVVLHLSGEEVPLLLAKGCTLDIDPSVFQVGDCAQSGLAKANVLLGYIDAAPVYEIIVRRSFSEYLLQWLRQNTHSRVASASY